MNTDINHIDGEGVSGIVVQRSYKGSGTCGNELVLTVALAVKGLGVSECTSELGWHNSE